MNSNVYISHVQKDMNLIEIEQIVIVGINVGKDEEGATITCKCMCHSDNFIVKIYYKIVTFFNKFLGRNQVCECGALHYEKK